MLTSLTAFLGECFGDSAFVTKEHRYMIEFMIQNEILFEELWAVDKEFILKYLYAIDMGFNELCISARRGRLDPTALDFNNIRSSIKRRNFNIVLPHELLTKSSRKFDGDMNDDDGRNKRSKKGELVTNPDKNPAWLLKHNENESYGKTIHVCLSKGNVKPPMWDAHRESCAAYHHKGFCHSKCPRAYAHSTSVNAIPSEAISSHNKFIVRCREVAPSLN